MVEIGNLSEFNKSRKRNLSECEDKEIVSIISDCKELFPNIIFLLTETTRFYSEKFNELHKYIKREKRLVVFETPSRVSLSHEYTVEGAGSLKSGFHFLFNTVERLSWLKIEMEGRRISIGSKEKVIELLKEKIESEIKVLAEKLQISKENTALRLYNASDGKPCFVEFNQIEQKGQQSLLFSVKFFDSIRDKEKKKCSRCLSPLLEKQINYNYSTLSASSNAWIYFKAPSNFVLSVSHDAKDGEYEASQSNDDEITSLVLTPSGDKLSVNFVISIDVPRALKVWYNAMLYLAIVFALCGILAFVHLFFVEIPKGVIDTLHNCAYAIIASLIATRGWLMSEEQVMRKMSNWYTYLILVIIGVVMALAFKSNYDLKIKETSRNASSCFQDNSVMKNSVIFVTDTISVKSNEEIVETSMSQ